MDADQAAAKLEQTMTALHQAELKLARLITAQNDAIKETKRLEAQHVNFREYEKRALKALEDKDKELMKRETDLNFSEGSLAHVRSTLQSMSS